MVQLGCGGLGLDFLVTVKGYPNPDDKIRSTTSLVGGFQRFNLDFLGLAFECSRFSMLWILSCLA